MSAQFTPLIPSLGPPNIDFGYCDNMKRTDNHDLVAGFISTYSEYWTDEGVVRAPEILRKVYNDIAKMIRKASIRKKADYRNYWFTREAWSAIDCGVADSPVALRP